jgi:hypothetical protein
MPERLSIAPVNFEQLLDPTATIFAQSLRDPIKELAIGRGSCSLRLIS